MELTAAIRFIENKSLTHISGPQTWADLGCGDGRFTEALACLLPDGSTIFALDREDHFRIPHIQGKEGTRILFKQQDIQAPLDLPVLDGILMANVLHYIGDQSQLIADLAPYTRPHAHILVVEYDTDKAVRNWVPYPVSFNSLKNLFLNAGFSNIELLNRRPSRYRRDDLYAALISR